MALIHRFNFQWQLQPAKKPGPRDASDNSTGFLLPASGASRRVSVAVAEAVSSWPADHWFKMMV